MRMRTKKSETLELAYRLAPIFSSTIFNEFGKHGESRTLKRIIREQGNSVAGFLSESVADFYELVYGKLYDCYRNEYVFKNVMTNKLLLGRHSPKTSTMLSEFRVANSKADIVFVNGTSHAYEIKTEFDGLDRLDGQLTDYQKCFDKVSVVTSVRHVPALADVLHRSIGLLVLTRAGSLSSVREPESNLQFLRPDIIFDTLRKNEYVPAIRKFINMPSDIPNALEYQCYKDVFVSLSPAAAHEIMVTALRDRGRNSAFVTLLGEAPKSLKAATLSLRITEGSLGRLLRALQEPASSLVA